MMNTLCHISRRNLHQFRRFHKCVIRPTAAAEPSAQVKEEIKPVLEIKTENKPAANINKIADDIIALNLIEVAALNELLKKRLNLPDAPVMSFAAGPPVAKEEEDEAVVQAAQVQTAFTVKLVGFDAAKKIDLIKGIKVLLPDWNLVKAKKFVESLPGILKADVSKEEADKVKEALEPLGAEIKIV